MGGSNAAETTPPPGQGSASEGHPRDEGHLIAIAYLQDVLRLAFDEVVTILNRNDPHDRSSACQLVDRDVTEADMSDLPLGLKLGQCADRFFERYDRIDRMKLIELDSLKA